MNKKNTQTEMIWVFFWKEVRLCEGYADTDFAT
jgi:hypothetical protein